VGLQVRQIVRDSVFGETFGEVEGAAWRAYKSSDHKFLRKLQGRKLRITFWRISQCLITHEMQNIIKIKFFSPLKLFPTNTGAVSEAHAESIHLDITTVDKWWQGKLSSNMLAGYCWTLNEWINECVRVGHSNLALAPRPSLIYCASLLINPLLILCFGWNVGHYLWGRHNSHLFPRSTGPGDEILNTLWPHNHIGYVWLIQPLLGTFHKWDHLSIPVWKGLLDIGHGQYAKHGRKSSIATFYVNSVRNLRFDIVTISLIFSKFHFRFTWARETFWGYFGIHL
jgi:hypothetical protein